MTPVQSRPSVAAAGPPFDSVSGPAQGLMVQVRGEPILHRGEYALEIDVDASYDYGSRIRAIAWELRKWGQFRGKRAYADRNGQGPAHAELSAAIERLRAGHMYMDAPVHIRADNKLTTGIFTGLWTARQRQIEQLSEQLWPVLDAHRVVAVTWVRTREIRKVDSEAHEFRDKLGPLRRRGWTDARTTETRLLRSFGGCMAKFGVDTVARGCARRRASMSAVPTVDLEAAPCSIQG